MDTHQHNFHIGREQTLCLLQNIYWIPSCRGLIRKILNECLYCTQERINAKTTYMSDLPKDRMLIKEKPFTSTGIDFLGPILVKTSRGTRSNPAKAKRYGVIFTCVTVRAIHLELANNLSTDAFIMALCPFHSYQGRVKIIRSDNGTNFVEAVTELKEVIKRIDHSKVVKYCSERQIDFQWIFNPPLSP